MSLRYLDFTKPGTPPQKQGRSVSVIQNDLLLQELQNQGPVRFVDHWFFNTLVMSAIIANAIQMGLEVQLDEGGYAILWVVLEHFFTAFFLIEMIIKLSPLMGPREYFSQKANWLDFIVVMVAILDNWIISLALQDDSSGVGIISILRLVRLARILKLLKAKKELTMLLEGIVGSIRSMFWLSILLGILIYTVAIVFVKFIGESDAYEDTSFDNKKYFGDLIKACITALNLALLEDFSTVFRAVIQSQPHIALGIGCYVGISCFGIMNAIIGVIVTRTSEAASVAAAEENRAMKEIQMDFVESVKEMIYQIDADGDGTVSPEEILQAEDNEALIDALSHIQLPSGFSMLELHCMLDKDGDGELSKFEFAQGMKRMIFSNDFQRQCLMMLAVAQQKRKLHEVKDSLEMQMEKMSTKIHEKLNELPGLFQKMLDSHVPKTQADGTDGANGKEDALDKMILPEAKIAGMPDSADAIKAAKAAWSRPVESNFMVPPGPGGSQLRSHSPAVQATAHALREVSNAIQEIAIQNWNTDDDVAASAPASYFRSAPAPAPAYQAPPMSRSDGFLYPGLSNQHMVREPLYDNGGPQAQLRPMSGRPNPGRPMTSAPAGGQSRGLPDMAGHAEVPGSVPQGADDRSRGRSAGKFRQEMVSSSVM